MSAKQNDLIVFMGRFQPPHNAHLTIINKALELSHDVAIMIGSSNIPRTPKNPFKADERQEMITQCLDSNDQNRVMFYHIEDRMYNDQEWCSFIQHAANDAITRTAQDGLKSPDDVKVALIGHDKDDSTYYLNMFPQWHFIQYPEHNEMNATDIRDVLFDEDHDPYHTEMEKMPQVVKDYIDSFKQTKNYDYVCNEHSFIKKYKEMWEDAPYPPTFNAADAVVIQSGHILLVKRKAYPGKDTWAIPGGYIGQDETAFDAAIRELREETKLKVPEPVLRGSCFDQEIFDHPKRSLRGRVFSHSFGFHLKDGPLPKVKGSDDAQKASWFTIDQVLNMRSELFEDHADIINYFVGRL